MPNTTETMTETQRTILRLSQRATNLRNALDEAMDDLEAAEVMVPGRHAALTGLQAAFVATVNAHAALQQAYAETTIR